LTKHRAKRGTFIAALSLALLNPPFTAGARAQQPESLGDVAFQVSCATEVQAPLNRAVALLHHMTYPRARAEFSAIAAGHPECAMAYWGIAMTLFQPLWPTRPTADDLRRGREALSMARKAGPGSERERMYVAAAGAFFDSPDADYWERIAGWERATRQLYEANPGDLEAAAFFALSHLAVAPSTGGLINNEEAAEVLEDILRQVPTHPGAIHYMIHANDADARQDESLDVVARYSTIAPRNPHALHMPTHIYVRRGDWGDVVEGNLQAALAALESPAGDQGQWVWDEFPHAIEYLVYALLQTGDDRGALEQMVRLQETRRLQPGFKTAFHLSSVPARYALERRDWGMAAGLEPRPDETLEWDQFPWPEAVTRFARGVGAARLGDVRSAQEAGSRLSALREASSASGEDLFARQTEILRLGLDAWTAWATGDGERAVTLMREAVELEATTPKHAVTPAPTLPASEMLGDLLMELNRPEAALEAYRASLARTPGRLNGLIGAARAAARSGDVASAVGYYREVRGQLVEDSPRPEAIEASAYLDGHGGGRSGHVQGRFPPSGFRPATEREVHAAQTRRRHAVRRTRHHRGPRRGMPRAGP